MTKLVKFSIIKLGLDFSYPNQEESPYPPHHHHLDQCLHASAVVVEDEAYLFSADCGTGKSTHTSLWLKYLADKNPYILNDDKPAIRVTENGIFAYGTPFSGKNDINENKKVKVKGICFLEQAPQNSIEKLEISEAFKLFWGQTTDKYFSHNPE